MTADHWVRFKTGNIARRMQEMPFKGTVQRPLQDFEDDFSGEKLRMEWTWNYPYADIDATLKDGCLQLTGTPHEGNHYGTALCLRPQWPHYRIETQVDGHHAIFQGLTLYGDDKNLIMWGVEGDRWILKSVQDGTEKTLYADTCSPQKPFLKVEVAKGCQFRFYRSGDGKQWTAVTEEAVEGSFLTRWDRVQRPGLLHSGDSVRPARFTYFAMKHLKE